MQLEELKARARATPNRPEFWKELRALAVPDGTLCLLVKLILEQRDVMAEMLARMQMINQEAIYRGIGQQGQVMGVDTILHSIIEAMKEPEHEPTEEVSTDQRISAP